MPDATLPFESLTPTQREAVRQSIETPRLITLEVNNPEGVVIAKPAAVGIAPNGTYWNKATGYGDTGWLQFVTIAPTGAADLLGKITVADAATLATTLPAYVGQFALQDDNKTWWVGTVLSLGGWSKMAQAPSDLIEAPTSTALTNGLSVTAGDYYSFTDPRSGAATIWKCLIDHVSDDGAAGAGGSLWSGAGDNRPGVYNIATGTSSSENYFLGDEDWRNLAEDDIGGGHTAAMWEPWVVEGYHYHRIEAWPGEGVHSGNKILVAHGSRFTDYHIYHEWFLRNLATGSASASHEWRGLREGSWLQWQAGVYYTSREIKQLRMSSHLGASPTHRSGLQTTFMWAYATMTPADVIDKVLYRIAARSENGPSADTGSSTFFTHCGDFTIRINGGGDDHSWSSGMQLYMSHGSRLHSVRIHGLGALESTGELFGVRWGKGCDDWTAGHININPHLGDGELVEGSDVNVSSSRTHMVGVSVAEQSQNFVIDIIVAQSLGIVFRTEDLCMSWKVLSMETEHSNLAYRAGNGMSGGELLGVNFRRDDGQGWGTGPVMDRHSPIAVLDDMNINVHEGRIQGIANVHSNTATGHSAQVVQVNSVTAYNFTLPTAAYYLQGKDTPRSRFVFDWSYQRNAIPSYQLPVYADEAAAVTGGLEPYRFYKTTTGEIRCKLDP